MKQFSMKKLRRIKNIKHMVPSQVTLATYASKAVAFVNDEKLTNRLALILTFLLVTGGTLFAASSYENPWNGKGTSQAKVQVECGPDAYGLGNTIGQAIGTVTPDGKIESTHVQQVNSNNEIAIGCDILAVLAGTESTNGSSPIVVFNGEPAPPNPNAPIIQRYGLLGATDRQVIALLEKQPGTDVVYALQQDWVPGAESSSTSVYAANDGYSYLKESKGIVEVWKFTSGIAYLMFVVILIVAGFMIMFRHKVGGQMAVTVFNMLPNVVISLVVTVFSFAIAGLILNIGKLATDLTGLAMMKLARSLGMTSWQAGYVDSPWSIASLVLRGAGGLDFFMGDAAMKNVVDGMIGGLSDITIPVPMAPDIDLGGVISGLIAFILMIPILVIAIWLSLKVYITLLKAYLAILLDVVLAPIYVAVSALPGQSHQKINVFRRILKNSLVFTVVFGLVNLGVLILFSPSTSLSLNMPGGLLNGHWETNSIDSLQPLIKALAAFYLWSLASGVPKMLEDILPSATGRGMGEAGAIANKAMSGIPVIGGMFGG